MQELERAAYEVQVFENYLEVLLSVHKECGDPWNWESIHNSEPPTEPVKSNPFEIAALAELENYKPGIIDKIMKRVESKKEQLTKAVDEAKQSDEKNYQDALVEHEQKLSEWEKLTELAKKILADDPEVHLEAIQAVDPFSEINQLGSSIDFQFEGNLIEATLHVNGEEVIPSESKSLLKSGILSVKKMTKSNFYELYQDYVCGAVLRVARELFALLPIEMVIVTATGILLNTQTGHMEEQPILSVAIPRKTFENLNFDMIDPSDSMANFVHRMKFMKSKGFAQVERISPIEFQP